MPNTRNRLVDTTISSDDSEEEKDEELEENQDDDSRAGDLQQFMNDQEEVKPDDKIGFMMTLRLAYDPTFFTEVFPYNHKTFKHSKRIFKLNNQFLKKEILRRDPKAKLSNKKQPELLDLCLTELQICYRSVIVC